VAPVFLPGYPKTPPSRPETTQGGLVANLMAIQDTRHRLDPARLHDGATNVSIRHPQASTSLARAPPPLAPVP